MRILIASDKYKGSLSATAVAQILKAELHEGLPDVKIDLCPIADGGEGTTEAMIAAMNGLTVEVGAQDAQGRPLTATYGWLPEQSEAVMEMSAASGLALVSDLPLNPAMASTEGTGLMMLDALKRGARRIVIGIGGSATNDGGIGMAAALGYRFLNAAGEPLRAVMAEMDKLASIARPRLALPEILVACDVDNPLLGENGATRVYGPQKGVKDMAFFEERLIRIAEVAARDLGADPRETPGAGAAGGLGYGLMVFGGARLTSGFDLVAEQIGLHARLLHGKGPFGVAMMARAHGKKVVAFAGAVEASPVLRDHFDLTFATKPEDMALPEAMSRAGELLRAAAQSSLPEIRILLGLA
jgi:glycerate kinase